MQFRSLSKAPITNRTAGEAVRFLTVGVLATGIHLGLLFVLTELTTLWYLPATVIGFLVAFGLSFILQKLWTFKSRESAKTKTQLWQFLSLQLGALTSNTVGLYILVEMFDVWYLIGQAILLALVAVITFTVAKKFIFNVPNNIIHYSSADKEVVCSE